MFRLIKKLAFWRYFLLWNLKWNQNGTQQIELQKIFLPIYQKRWLMVIKNRTFRWRSYHQEIIILNFPKSLHFNPFVESPGRSKRRKSERSRHSDETKWFWGNLGMQRQQPWLKKSSHQGMGKNIEKQWGRLK